jgi:uncharacterized protein (TIGR03083 family)
MTLPTFDCIAAITEHSAGFAEAARGADLAARVEHCPDWSVADLVWHLTDVHWFWGTIVAETLAAPPEESRRPARPADPELVDAFVAGAARLVQVLREADQSAPCWTWASWQQDVAFVTRHQVQEAAVHHWDLAHATGAGWRVEPAVATDSVDEFLHFSVASDDDPDDPPETALDGTLALRATDTGDTWTLTDGDRPGTARVSRGAYDGPAVEASAADLLLWLYGRTEVDTSGVPEGLLARFRAITFTD